MTDSNGVLSDYSFSSSDSNVSVSKSGNKLTISSTVAISGSVRITAKRNNVPTVSSSAKLIAYGDPNLQDLVTGVENADTVSAYINIETPTGTIALKKTSEDGVVEGISFTIKGDNFNKTVKTGKDGSVSVEGLFPGTYTVTEQSIDRYEPQKTQTVTLIGGKTSTVTFSNTLKRGSLEIVKTSEDNLVERMKFHLYGTSLSGLPVDEYAVTDKNGLAKFENVLISGDSLKRFADREEMEIVGIYEDAGKSGKSIEGRPAFKKMLSDIKNGLEIDYILVYKLSRFGRNAADILNSLEFVQSYGINLICIEEGIDSSQTSGKLLISVLSAVAEIERENIIEQTMNGRREKARQGGWNGGFAPYGYYLKDNQLLIEETEAEAIRIIFDKFANSDVGLGGVAKYLNLQGIKKIPRQNGTLETWSSHFIRLILDNPVYCGKIAYGRRTREKVKGTKNEYKQVHTDDYILEDGQHEGIVSEELWQKAHTKRMATGIKQPSKIGKDRSHLLTGILKCPLCGSSMYTNKHAWTNKDGTYKEVYYYICGRNKQERGHHCDYKASLRKTDIEPLVIEAVKELVSDKYFAKEIEKRIGVQTDTTAIDKELANYESKLKEVDLNKARLEREIDNLPIDARFRERKIHDMTLRLDGLYDTIVELEERIEDAKLRRSSIEMEAITLDNIYKLMLNFGKLYDIISDEEKKSLITYLIKEIQIYPNGESEQPLKSIEFNFPIYRDGKEVRRLLWEKGNTVESVVLLSR